MAAHFHVRVSLSISSYLILDHCSTKSPDGSKHKIKLIGFLGAVCRDVLLGQEAFEKVAQHLNHALLWDWNYLLKSVNKDQDMLLSTMDVPFYKSHWTTMEPPWLQGT